MTTPDPREPARISDPRFDAAWRTLSAEEPPATIDAAILAAVRREVGAKPQRTDAREALAARRHWWPLAAAATVAAIAVGVLQLTPPDRLGAPAPATTVVTDMPTPATGEVRDEATTPPRPEERASVPQRTDQAAPASRGDVAAGAAASRAESSRRPVPQAAAPVTGKQAPTPPPPAPLPGPFPAAPPTPSQEVAPSATSAADGRVERAPPVRDAAAPPPAPAATGMVQRAQESPSARTAPLAKTAAGRTADAGADEARANDRGPLPVPDWIALIRRLRDDGRSADAARELAAFRAAHADHAKLLPPDLRDWRPPEK